MTAEMQVVRDAAKQDGFDKNLFLVDDGSFVGGLGFAKLNQRYTYIHVNQILAPPADSPNQTAAHEVGHSMGLSHVYEDDDPIDADNPRDIKNLMDPFASANKWRLRWNQWNKLNP
jgi:predicted Zn-dependent protease